MSKPENEVQWFEKLPVKIQAMRWNGRDNDSGIGAVLEFIETEDLPRAPDDPHVKPGIGFTPSDGNLFIPTLEGTMTARPGDWIIKGVKGEYYPCKPDIFAATYRPFPPSAPPPTETARQWLCKGGYGHEDGEDGIRAGMWSVESAIEAMDEYAAYYASSRIAELTKQVEGLEKENAELKNLLLTDDDFGADHTRIMPNH